MIGTKRCKRKDTGNQEGENVGGVRDKNLPIGYNEHYSGNRHTKPLISVLYN